MRRHGLAVIDAELVPVRRIEHVLQIEPAPLEVSLRAEPDNARLIFPGNNGRLIVVSRERFRLVVVQEQVLAHLGPDLLQDVAYLAENREVAEDGVLTLMAVLAP